MYNTNLNKFVGFKKNGKNYILSIKTIFISNN